ncbi:MAG: dihydroorotate dehydrogenase, partial [Spirochaetales bacterium]|nr:dihydroorotate dehydrogenase [Spirochaetales bacterium]
MTDLHVDIAGVLFPNPILPASGTYEVVELKDRFFDPAVLGAVINKTIFLQPRPGNPPPRIYETPCGMLNSIGIPSEGAEHFIREQLPALRRVGPPVIVSVAETSLEGFRRISLMIEETGMADLLELDLSCPNVGHDAQWAE